MEDTEPRKVADSRNETVNHESLHQRNGSLVDENTKNIELDCGNCYNEINGAGSKSGECYSKDTVEKAKDFRFLMCHSTFNCRFCGNCFPNARKLKHHVITIHKCLKPYKCSRCLAAFCDARRLYYHMVTHTKPVVDCHHLLRPCDTKKCKDNENIKCSCCHKVFNSKASLIMHLKNRNGFQQTGTYKCVYCSGSFVSPYELDRHISVHKKYRCPHCKTCFSRLLLLKKHKCNSLEEGKESCDTLLMVKGSQKRKKQLVKSSLQETKGTNKTMDRTEEFVRTESVVSNQQNYSQSAETKGLSENESDPTKTHIPVDDESRTQEHISNRNSTVTKKQTKDEKVFKYKCPHCDVAFMKKGFYERHAYKHGANIPWKCEECNESFVSKSRFKEHRNQHGDMKPFKCDICSKGFASHVILVVHKRSHTGERPFECKECHATFKQRSNLVDHLKTHRDLRNHICDICGKGFNLKGDLKKHTLIHTDDKPFKCKECQMEFFRVSNFNRHMRAHRGEKPHVCGICQKAFSREEKLKEHKNTHSGARPFICAVCGKAFKDSGNLSNHKRIHIEEKSCRPKQKTLKGETVVFGSVSQHCENNANVNTDNVTPLLTLSTSNGQQIISVEVEANKGSQFVRIAPNRNQIPSVVLEDQVGQSIAKSVTLNSPKQPPPVFSVPVVNQDTQPTVLSIEVEVNNQHEEPVVSSASSVPLSQSGPLVQLSQGSDGVVLQNAAVLHLTNDQSNMLTNFDTSFSPQGGYITQIGNLIGSLEAAAALGQLQQGNPEHFVALSSSLDLRLLNVLPVTSMENDPNLQHQMIPVDQFIQTDQSTNNPSHFEQPHSEFITILPDQPTIAARDSSTVHSVVISEHSMGHNFVITDNIESQAMTSESHSTTLSPGIWTFRREISDQAINSVNLINRTDTSSVQPSGSEVGLLSGSQIGEHAGSQLGQPPESQMGWYVSKDTGHGTIEHECSGLSVLGISQQDETSGHFQAPTLHSQQMDSTQDILKTLAQELQVAVISDESLMTLPDNEDVQHTASSSVINEGDL